MPTRKKICLVLPAHWESRMGGAQYQAKMIVEYLISQDRYEIYYLARYTNDDFEPVNYRIINIAKPKGIRKYGEIFDTLSLYKALATIRPDVIYQRVGCAYTGICAYYAKKNNCKSIWHVALDSEVTAGTPKISKNWFFKFLDKQYLEYGIRQSEFIITQTGNQAELMRKHYDRTADLTLANVHPLPEKEAVKATDYINIVWVANIKPWKRPDEFMRLAKDMSGNPRCKFIMIGKALANRKWCENIINEMRQIENLDYLGGQSQEFVNEQLSKAHVFVNTSVEEGFANTFIQSWLRRVPVLSLGVNPDGVFDNREIGMCANSYEELMNNLMYLVDNPSVREEMGLSAEKYAREVHGISNLHGLIEIISDE